MSKTLILSAVCVAALAVATESAAQTSPDRPAWTFGATAGGGETWDDEGSIGRGWLVGGYADRRISRNIDLELAVDSLMHERYTGPSSFQAEGHTTYLSAAVLLRLGSARASGFALGGGTIGIHRGTAGFADEPVQADTDGTHAGLIFGGGLSFRTARNLEIAPTVRITTMAIDDDSDPAISIMGGIRVGFGR